MDIVPDLPQITIQSGLHKKWLEKFLPRKWEKSQQCIDF